LPVVLSALVLLTAAIVASWVPAARAAHRRHAGPSHRVKCRSDDPPATDEEILAACAPKSSAPFREGTRWRG
jgi:hypothetical protein